MVAKISEKQFMKKCFGDKHGSLHHFLPLFQATFVALDLTYLLARQSSRVLAKGRLVKCIKIFLQLFHFTRLRLKRLSPV